MKSKDSETGNFTKSSFIVEKPPLVMTQADVGIITIRDDELQAVLDRFNPTDTFPGKNRTYATTQIETELGQTYKVAILQCTGQGEGHSQEATHDLIEDLNPRWIFLVGIAGAIPSNEFTLGDVLLANRLHDFTVAALKEGQLPTFEQEGGEMHPVVVDFLKSLKYFRELLINWNSNQSINCFRPTIEVNKENFQGDKEWKEDVEKSLEFHVREGRNNPIFKVTPFGSSDALIRDPSRLSQWLESARHLEGVEMELGGVYRAARRINREYPIIAIRGISDIVGLRRDDRWTKYACNSAAAFAYALIKSGKLRLDIR